MHRPLTTYISSLNNFSVSSILWGNLPNDATSEEGAEFSQENIEDIKKIFAHTIEAVCGLFNIII